MTWVSCLTSVSLFPPLPPLLPAGDLTPEGQEEVGLSDGVGRSYTGVNIRATGLWATRVLPRPAAMAKPPQSPQGLRKMILVTNALRTYKMLYSLSH